MDNPNDDSQNVPVVVGTLTTPSQQHQEEGVLNDVLQELDRERTRRAELEAQVRSLTEEQLRQTTSLDKDNQSLIEKRELLALQTERDELVKLVDAMTSDNDAISAASKPSPSAASLPMHVIRLLELMPWDQRARQHAVATEEVYEWQIYDVKGSRWTSQLRQFPPFFRTMPITKPTPGHTMDESMASNDLNGRNFSRRIFGGEAPPKQCVMTDAAATRVFNVNDGFPLPKDSGTWQWIGGWRIDKRAVVDPNLGGSPKSKIDCDENGWSYAEDPRHFQTNPTELCWDSAGETGESSSVYRRKVRRRKWTRRRALMAYPGASTRTTEYLKVILENEICEVTNAKLNDQLVETKVLLTECEEKLMNMEETEKKVPQLEAEITRLRKNSSKLYTELNKSKGKQASSRKGDSSKGFLGRFSPELRGDSSDTSSENEGSRRSLLENVENIGAAFNSMMTDSSTDKFRSRSDDETSSSSNSQTEELIENDSATESFDWKRLGRGSVFEKLKRSPAVKSIESWRSPAQSGEPAVVATEQSHDDLALPTLK